MKKNNGILLVIVIIVIALFLYNKSSINEIYSIESSDFKIFCERQSSKYNFEHSFILGNVDDCNNIIALKCNNPSEVTFLDGCCMWRCNDV